MYFPIFKPSHFYICEFIVEIYKKQKLVFVLKRTNNMVHVHIRIILLTWSYGGKRGKKEEKMNKTRSRGYNTFFVLSSAETKINPAHNQKISINLIYYSIFEEFQFNRAATYLEKSSSLGLCFLSTCIST